MLLSAALLFSCKSNRQKVKPEIGKLTESVYASLTVEPYQKYQAYSAVGGIVSSIAVDEGDTVVAGQTLLQIDNTNPELNAENARLAYELARENYYGKKNVLDELKSQIKTAALQLSNDSINYYRQKRLIEQNIGSQSDFEKRELAYQKSQNQLRLLKIKYQQTKNQLQTALRQAENNYKTSQKTRNNYTVRSEIDGKVYQLMKEKGELVGLQEPVALIGSRDSFLLELLVDEVDIPKIEIGQRALVRLDAYGKRIFDATIEKIYPRMDPRSQTFKIEASFEKQADKLYPGLTGEANIVVREKEGVITIPSDYLQEGNQVITDSGLKSVEVGLRNFEKVEILTELDTAAFIYKEE
jgi:multidrug efflux pump subunit AcrA (membrane-fusion protein)